MTPERDDHEKLIEITIDQETFNVRAKHLTGAELRELPQPDVGPDRDLYLEEKHHDDRLITDAETVELKNAMHFFTAPAMITPGHAS